MGIRSADWLHFFQQWLTDPRGLDCHECVLFDIDSTQLGHTQMSRFICNYHFILVWLFSHINICQGTTVLDNPHIIMIGSMSLSPPVLIRLRSSSWSISQWKFQEAEFHVSKTVNPFGIFWIALHFGHFWWQYLSYSPLCSPSQTSWGDECCLLPACRGVGWHGPHGPSAESWRCVGWPKSLDLFNTHASKKKTRKMDANFDD